MAEKIKTTLRIKNMVCPRCVLIVREQLLGLKAEVLHLELGLAQVSIPKELTMAQIEKALSSFGFELIADKEAVLVEKIKEQIDDYLHYLEKRKDVEPLSLFLSRNLGRNYGSLSGVFSAYEKNTIEKYWVEKKINRVKELLKEDKLTLNQIVVKLKYSSVHYLSHQFKKTTGMTISSFKEQQGK